jgi:hypothetical protein
MVRLGKPARRRRPPLLPPVTAAARGQPAGADARTPPRGIPAGELDSAQCFEAARINSSAKNEEGVDGLAALPNGWKVAFKEKRHWWTLETWYEEDERCYKCQHRDAETGAVTAESSSFDNPTSAFREAYAEAIADETAPKDRPNGKLFVGLYYSNIQNELKRHFRQVRLAAAPGADRQR